MDAAMDAGPTDIGAAPSMSSSSDVSNGQVDAQIDGIRGGIQADAPPREPLADYPEIILIEDLLQELIVFRVWVHPRLALDPCMSLSVMMILVEPTAFI
jgi:hypothetical protein